MCQRNTFVWSYRSTSFSMKLSNSFMCLARGICNTACQVTHKKCCFKVHSSIKRLEYWPIDLLLTLRIKYHTMSESSGHDWYYQRMIKVMYPGLSDMKIKISESRNKTNQRPHNPKSFYERICSCSLALKYILQSVSGYQIQNRIIAAS